MTLDVRRAAAGRLACCCCCRSRGAQSGRTSPRGSATAFNPPAEAIKGSNPVVAHAITSTSTGIHRADSDSRRSDGKAERTGQTSSSQSPRLLERFFGNALAPLLLKRPVQISVLVAFAAMLAVGIVGAATLETEFSEENFLPDDSYLQDYFDAQDRYFADTESVQVVLRPENGYLANEATILNLEQQLRGSTYVVEGSLESWHDAYLAWLRRPSNPRRAQMVGDPLLPASESQYVTWLEEFIAGEGGRFTPDVKFENSTTGSGSSSVSIGPSRIFVELDQQYLTSSSAKVDAMEAIRGLVDTHDGDLRAFPFSFQFIEWELFSVARTELFRNIALSLAAVFIITLVLIAHPGTSLLVFLSIAMTIVDLMGLMWLWGVDIDSVAVINLVLAIGLAIDYSAHVGHAFMTHTGSREERVQATLRDMGAPVFNGAFSTFLAVVVLAFSKSYVFRVFFKQFFGIVVFGVLHGLVFLPVLLALVGPQPYPHASSSKEHSSSEQGSQAVELPAKQLTV